ncbi:MAG: hypothetical protein K8R58_12130 [Bacteroidales bacterium]|nr:hypothetical protein [Bacteroidales bacterium]
MKNNKKYIPPKTIWEVYDNLDYNEALDIDDKRYVDISAGREEFSFKDILSFLKVSRQYKFMGEKPPQKIYAVFFGHRGCGKSTELKRLAEKLDKEKLFFVVNLDTSIELDNNNVKYVDVFMALAKRLFDKLERHNIEIDPVYFENLESWFQKKIIINEERKDYALDIKAGVEGKVGLPFIGKIFANMTTAFKDNSSYKEQLREDIKNNFSEFAAGFNKLIAAANEAVAKKIDRKAILFVIDGLDKLSGEDSSSFFISDVNQLQQIQSNFIYTAHIDLLYSGTSITQVFEFSILPMIKIAEQNDKKFNKGYEALRKLIYKRADKSLFTSEKIVDRIIEFSGGNPRHILQLLEYAYINAGNNIFDKEAVDKGVVRLANIFKRFLTKEDYEKIYEIDNSDEPEQSEHIRKLLHNLAILQYNDFWWKSHPVIRTLPSYKKLEKAK